MEPIGFAFDNFNFVVYPLKLSGVDGVIAMVDDPVTVTVQHFNKSVYRSYFKGASQIAPLIESLFSPGPLAVGPNMFEFFLKDHDRVDYLV